MAAFMGVLQIAVMGDATGRGLAGGDARGVCTAVVVNHNAGAVLTESVTALLKTPAIRAVRVIDNASSDASMRQLESAHRNALRNRRLVLLPQTTNHGFAWACNVAAQGVGTPYLAFVNPDCVVRECTIPCLIGALEKHPEAALAGAWVTNPDGSEQRATRRRLPTPWRVVKTISGLEKLAVRWPDKLAFLAGVNQNLGSRPEKTVLVEAVSGALMLLRRADFEAVNGFDSAFPLHFEDLDLFARLHKAGRKILLVPEAKCVHHQGVCSRNKRRIKQLKRYGLRLYWHKHGRNPLTRLMVRLIPVASLPPVEQADQD